MVAAAEVIEVGDPGYIPPEKIKKSDIKASDYDVDHVYPLAKHWAQKGYNSDDSARHGVAGNVKNLKLIRSYYNRQAGADGHRYEDKPFVGPNFISIYNNSVKGAKKIKGKKFKKID